MKRIVTSLFVCWLILGQFQAQEISGSFMQEVISDAIFARIKGKSFKENCTTPREDLRYLRVKHYNKDGDVQEGELI